MKKFSITEVALSGYRLMAARPGAAFAWLIFQLVVAVVTLALTVAIAGPEMTALSEMQAAGGTPDPATTMALSGKVMLSSLVIMLVAFVAHAIAIGAVSRAVLRPGEGSFGYLRFGRDELRLIVVLLVLGILIYITYMLAVGPAMAVLFALAGPQQAAMAMQGSGALPASAIASAAAAAIPGTVLMIFLSVKLSLAGAQTVAERGMHFFGSWTLTKGVFWRTLGAYALAALPVVVVGIVAIGVTFATLPGGIQGMMQPDVSSMSVAFAPTRLPSLALGVLFQTVMMAGLMAPPAAVYAAITLRANEAVADVFGDDEDEDEEA